MEFPKVTVGIPVYNEELNISSTLDSLLEQDYNNFEILISDNKSTDKTVEIIEKFIQKHSKIRLLRNEVNVGALENWNRLIRKADGKYFMIAGSHDLLSNNYISSLVESLENNPNAVLAYAKTIWIDETGKSMNIPCGYVDTSGFNLIRRFNLVFFGNQHALYGVFKLSALRKTRLQTPVIAAGAILLNELSVLGDLIVNPNAIWYRRINRKKENQEERLSRYYRTLFRKKRIRIFPYWKAFIYYLAIPFLPIRIPFFKKVILFFNIFFIYILVYHYNLFIAGFISIIKRIFKLHN